MQLVTGGARINIISYDFVSKLSAELKALNHKIVVCDEAHYIKTATVRDLRHQDPKTIVHSCSNKPIPMHLPSLPPSLPPCQSQRCKAALPLLQQARRSVLLTGTPALSRPSELITLLQVSSAYL